MTAGLGNVEAVLRKPGGERCADEVHILCEFTWQNYTRVMYSVVGSFRLSGTELDDLISSFFVDHYTSGVLAKKGIFCGFEPPDGQPSFEELKRRYGGYVRESFRRHCLSHLKHRDLPLPLDSSDHPDDPPTDLLGRRKDRRLLTNPLDDGIDVERALNKLNETDREIIYLRHERELSFDEIAQHLGITSGAARVRHLRARANLQGELGQ